MSQDSNAGFAPKPTLDSNISSLSKKIKGRRWSWVTGDGSTDFGRFSSRMSYPERIQFFARKVLATHYFDLAIGLVILANSVTLGLDQSLRLQGEASPVIAVLEQIFLVIYVVELSLRFLAYSYHCLADNWVKFDAFLVVCGVLTNWIIEPIAGSIEGMGLLLVLRLARLLRLARAVRLLVKGSESSGCSSEAFSHRLARCFTRS